MKPFVFGGRSTGVQHLALIDEGIDDVHLATVVDLAADKAVETLAFCRREELGLDLDTPRWHLVDPADVQITVHGQRQAARDRRCAHHQNVGLARHLAAQRAPLFHAESMLLVDDDEPQVGELDPFLHQRRRAHDEIDLTCPQRSKQLFARAPTTRPVSSSTRQG